MQAVSGMRASFLCPSALGARVLTSRMPRRREASFSSSVDIAGANEAEERRPMPFSEMPGPRRWPLVGSMPAMITHPNWDVTRRHKIWTTFFKEYGPVFRVQLPGRGQIVFLSQPRDIEQMMKSTQNNPVRPFFFAMKSVRDEIDFFKKNQTGILTEQGEEWWRVRRLVQPSAMKPKMVHQYLFRMDQVALEFVDRMAEIRDVKDELPGNFYEELFKWSLESVSLVVLNKRMGCLEGSLDGLRLLEITHKLIENGNKCEFGFHLWRLVRTPSFKKLKDASVEMLEIAIDAVKHAQVTLASKEDEGELNLVQALLNTPGLSFEDVVTHINDFFTAAVDTTSMAMLFTLYTLSRHPEQQAKLQQELDEVLGKEPTEPITTQKLARLSYTKACVRESLRLFPIFKGIPRRAISDLVLGGYHVPKGVTLICNNIDGGRNEAVFPQADEFRPERWLRSSRTEAINPYASIPFSTGSRMCIGNKISLQEIHVLLARMFQRYNLSYKYESWDPLFKFSLFPDKSQNFTVVER